MTKQIELLDALPGCGKTHSVFTYMAENQEKPWLYLTPTLKEITQRVPLESARTFMEFFYPDEESGTKSEQVFKALKNKENIACPPCFDA